MEERRRWKTDDALRASYSGCMGRYQIRQFALVCIVFAVVESWVPGFVYFNAIPPNSSKCLNQSSLVNEETARDIVESEVDGLLLADNINNVSMTKYNRSFMANGTMIITLAGSKPNNTDQNATFFEESDWSQGGVLMAVQVLKDFNVSLQEPRNIHIEFGLMCGEEYKVRFSRIGFLLSKHIGAMVCGHLADRVGRKVTMIGSSAICFTMILFQNMSEDFVSYCFFMTFIGFASGGAFVVLFTHTMESFMTKLRPVFAVQLLLVPCVFDLVIPWLAKSFRHWKLLQGITGIPLLLGLFLYWWSEETVYYYSSLRNYVGAIQSLTKIAKFNKVSFLNRFPEAKNYFRLKHPKGTQCDFQPLLRLQDIPKLKQKYPFFDFGKVMDENSQHQSFFKRMLTSFRGNSLSNNTTNFRCFDYLHSKVATCCLILLALLWFVNALSSGSLESHELSWRARRNLYTGYCYVALTSLVACLITMPVLYSCGRRWPTFCLYLVAEVCLLASIVAKIEKEFTSVAVTLIYLIGKTATFGSYVVIAVWTVEIFPTGLRCTSLGICCFFRGLGLIIADPDLLNFHDWTSRLVYGFLSLLFGSMALLLPDTSRFMLFKTLVQVEKIPSGIAKRIGSRAVAMTSSQVQPPISIGPGYASHSVRFNPIFDYDHQSTCNTTFYDMTHLPMPDSMIRHRHQPIINQTIQETVEEESLSANEDHQQPGEKHSAASEDQRNSALEQTSAQQGTSAPEQRPRIGEQKAESSDSTHASSQHMYDIEYKTQHEDAYFSENL